MIILQFDLGNAPSVLAAMSAARVANQVVKAAAESYVSDTHDWIDAGKGFTPHTGQLQQSINWHPTGNGTAEVYANSEYAGWVEYGTQPHVIAPKDGRKGLKIPTGGISSPIGPQMPGGGYVIRRSVNHPGSKPHPFFFAEIDERQQHMQERSLSVLASIIADAS